MGQAYVKVYGGIPQNDGKGLTGSGGGVTTDFWILWDNSGGFTGKYGWGAIKNHLNDTGWPEVATKIGVSPTYDNFVLYAGQAENLNDVFGETVWDSAAKMIFVIDKGTEIGGVITSENTDGCIRPL